jgi:hypothetical protein
VKRQVRISPRPLAQNAAFHAVVLPLSAGFKQLRDRLLYDDAVPLIFETREDADRFVGRAFDPSFKHEIVEVEIKFPTVTQLDGAALNECVNWETNRQGDCGGRMHRRLGVTICESCLAKLAR